MILDDAISYTICIIYLRKLKRKLNEYARKMLGKCRVKFV